MERATIWSVNSSHHTNYNKNNNNTTIIGWKVTIQDMLEELREEAVNTTTIIAREMDARETQLREGTKTEKFGQ